MAVLWDNVIDGSVVVKTLRKQMNYLGFVVGLGLAHSETKLVENAFLFRCGNNAGKERLFFWNFCGTYLWGTIASLVLPLKLIMRANPKAFLCDLL